MTKLDPELRRAVTPFRSHLTIEESTQIPGIYHDLKNGIYWGKLTETMLLMVTSVFGTALFRQEGRVPVWMRAALRAGLTGHELKVLYHPDRGELRREYVVLLLVKKMLGAMKTKVNQRLAEIEPMPGLAESCQFAKIETALGKGVLDDEEMLKVIGATLSGQPIEVATPLEKMTCKHQHRTLKYLSGKLHTWRVEICKLCGVTLEEEIGYDRRQFVKPTGRLLGIDDYRATTKPHEHKARWVPGKEGKEAYCPGCQKTLPDPEVYAWVAIGLEPFGDDPTKDELIVLRAEEA